MVPVIHEEDPQAKVVTNATSDILAPPDRRYLFGLLRSDVMPLIGAIATNPMFGTSPACEESRPLYEGYPTLARRIKDVARAHGFTGKLLSEARIWRTSENTLKSEPDVIAGRRHRRDRGSGGHHTKVEQRVGS